MAPRQPAKPSSKKEVPVLKKVRVSKSKQAGTIFPVGRIHRQLRDGRYASRISTTAAVFKAAVLEYLTAEVLEIAGEAAITAKRTRILPRHIMKAIKDDAELGHVLRDVNIPYAGVLPHIHPILLPKASDRNKLAAKKVKSTGKGKTKQIEPNVEEKSNDGEEVEVEEEEEEEEEEAEEEEVESGDSNVEGESSKEDEEVDELEF